MHKKTQTGFKLILLGCVADPSATVSEPSERSQNRKCSEFYGEAGFAPGIEPPGVRICKTLIKEKRSRPTG